MAQDSKALSLIVIGGGPGGYVAAIRAAQLGARVTLIEKDVLGGTCLNRGCMPTKALLHSAEIYNAALHSEALGVVGEQVRLNWVQVQQNRAQVVAKLTGGVAALMKANGISVIRGEARFVGERRIRVGQETLEADHIILAAGSTPILPPIEGLKECRARIDSTQALSLPELPESMVIIGGGVIGLELGSAYRRFGTKVSIVELSDHLLPQMDRELTELIKNRLEREGVAVYTHSKVCAVEDTADGALVQVESANGPITLSAQKVLTCVGRRPAVEALQPERAGIETKAGAVLVNDRMESSAKGVYAVGDCCGKVMLAHAAMAMGRIAAENAMGGNAVFNELQCPTCCFVGPELACVGLGEEGASAQSVKYRVGRFPTSANGRSLVVGETEGLVKVLIGEEYGELLGVHILAPHAADLIAEAALALQMEATVDELFQMIHCHPTVSESLGEAYLAAEGMAVHIPNRKKKPSPAKG
ncbi:MAG: dihydrolipoyl dehydrogenase [Oscillospiraceae bacterium]|nr:dihydrolipoyl dehydrogenase [Oscillospiraceae bacterium]